MYYLEGNEVRLQDEYIVSEGEQLVSYSNENFERFKDNYIESDFKDKQIEICTKELQNNKEDHQENKNEYNKSMYDGEIEIIFNNK